MTRYVRSLCLFCKVHDKICQIPMSICKVHDKICQIPMSIWKIHDKLCKIPLSRVVISLCWHARSLCLFLRYMTRYGRSLCRLVRYMTKYVRSLCRLVRSIVVYIIFRGQSWEHVYVHLYFSIKSKRDIACNVDILNISDRTTKLMSRRHLTIVIQLIMLKGECWFILCFSWLYIKSYWGAIFKAPWF
mgnify:CR=1 FL=1